jgi:hypothetical protein
MVTSRAGDFGRCCWCGGEIGLVMNRDPFAARDDEVEVGETVPGGDCVQCGRRYYKASTLVVLERTYARRQAARTGELSVSAR